MKKILVAALMWPLLVLAQSYPSPHFHNLTVDGTLNAGTIGLTNPLPVGSGGTGSSTATGATANLQYLGSGTGATARSLASKLGDLVSVADFGAPTGTDDTTAFSNTAAAAIAGNSQAIANPGWPSPNWAFAYIPPGTYTLTAPVNVSNKSFVWYAAPGAVINGPQYLNGRLERIGSKVTSQSSGITDNATTFTIAANQNYDEQAQVSGFTNTNQLSAGNGRDTVALYIGNTLPPSVYTSASVTSYSATGATLSTPLTTTQLGQLRVGMIVTTQHTPQPYSGVLTAWTANSITVSNWYLVTGTSGGAPATPTGTNGLDINTFRKVWAVNGNAFIAPSSYGSAINTVEWGMSNTKGAPQSQSGSVEANGVYMTNLAGAGAYGGDAAFFASGGSLSGGGWTWGYKADGGVQVPFYYNGSVNPAVSPTWLLQGINPSNQTFFTAGPDGSLNLGPQGAANTTTISFHSGATNTAYDSQINASGGTGTAGGGTLGLYASTLNLNASTVVNAGNTLRPSVDNSYGLGQSSFRWSSVNGVTGNFTNLNASGTVAGTGFSSYLASPPAIGGTTAAAGTFTTLTTTSSINGVAVATCKNAAGDGAIIQTAVNTGKPVKIVGTCVMDSSVTISTPGQEISGEGRHQTILNQSSVLSTGTFICSTGEPGPYFHDFAIQFTQPDTSTRASLTAYNPAFYCRNSPRSRFANLYIQAAMVAFDLQGNSGGSYLLNDEVSAFNAILILDGSLDTVRVDNLQGYNFGLTTNQLVIYRQSAAPTSSCSVFTGTVGICSGRMDDLKVKDSLFISGGPQIYFYAGTGGPGGTSWSTGPTFGSIEGTSFDTYWGIDSEGAGGIVRATGSYFNQAAGYSNMLVNNGTVSCSGCSFVVDANPAITIGSSGSVILSGGYAQLVTGNSFITNNGNLLLTGMMFQNGSTYNTGVITCPSAPSCTVVGNALPNAVSSATNFINFTGTKLSTGNYGATNWGSL